MFRAVGRDCAKVLSTANPQSSRLQPPHKPNTTKRVCWTFRLPSSPPQTHTLQPADP